jgi:hypothetical protein
LSKRTSDFAGNSEGVPGLFRKLAVQKESRIEEGHLMPDMMISIPPKYAVS